jgi:hypothetical protein
MAPSPAAAAAKEEESIAGEAGGVGLVKAGVGWGGSEWRGAEW